MMQLHIHDVQIFSGICRFEFSFYLYLQLWYDFDYFEVLNVFYFNITVYLLSFTLLPVWPYIQILILSNLTVIF